MHPTAIATLFIAASLVSVSVAGDEPPRKTVAGQHAVIGNAGEATGSHTAHPDAQWFPDAGLGLFLHWGISSVEGKNISWPMMAMIHDGPVTDPADQQRRIREKDYGSLTIAPVDYWAYAARFNPAKYHPEGWLRTAKEAGFRYVVLTAKHHEGFALWPSAYGDFNTKTYMEGRDLVKEYVAACRKVGLKVGLYYSAPDWYFDKEHIDFTFFNARKTNPWIPKLDYRHERVESIPKASPEHFKAYAEMTNGQIRELLTRYGTIDVLWFDGRARVGKEKIIGIEEIRTLQPGIVINPRMHKAGDFKTWERHLPDDINLPEGEWGEFCNPWNGAWPYVDKDYMHFNRFLDDFVRSRSQGINYLVSIGPKGNGDLDYRAYDELKKLKDWMDVNGEATHGVRELGEGESCSFPAVRKGDVRYVFLMPADKRKDRLPRQETVVFVGIGEPDSIVLLGRSAACLRTRHEDGTLSIEVPADALSRHVDVLRIDL